MSQQRWRHQIRLAWKLVESENQAEILHFVDTIHLTQFCVYSIHILSTLRKGIKLGIPIVPAYTVHHKYFDASSKVSHLHFQFPIVFQSHGSCVRAHEISCYAIARQQQPIVLHRLVSGRIGLFVASLQYRTYHFMIHSLIVVWCIR